MKKLKRKTKWMGLLLSLCMVLSIVPLTAVASVLDSASISVTFRQGSENNGWIEIKNGTDWTRYNSSEAQNAEAVRIRSNTDYSVDWAGISLRVNGTDILTDDIRNQLTGENGYTLTAGTEYALENVEFRQGSSNSGNPPETQSVNINFGSGSWTVGDQTVTADKNGIQDLAMDDVITLTGFDADTMQVTLKATDGFSTTLIVTDGKTSLSKRSHEGGFPDNVTLTFSVVEKGEPGPGDDPSYGGYEGEEKTASVTVTGKADFYINDSRMINANNGDSFDNVNYHYDGGGYVDFYFNCFIMERITELKINGVDYYSSLPTPSTEEGKEALLAACKGQLNEFKITVPYSESGYTIDSNVKWLDDTDKDYMVVGNFLWTYEDENQGDDYIDHGRMELLNVNYNGTVYSPDDLNNPGTAIDWGQDEHGGGAVLPVGAVVTVKLLPDYGYQLTSFGINGGNFGTGDEQSVFTFEIRPGNGHIGAHFTPVADKVASSSDTVTSGSIELGSSLSGGSAQLEISDAKDELSDEKLEAFETAAGNYTVTDYLNFDLYNVYYKGSTDADDVWKNEVNTLDNDAAISVSLADSPLEGTVNPSDIVIIHNIHNGEDFETILVDSYDSETNTITFKTDSFSTYAIATTSEEEHTHIFAESWTYDADGHWKECECGEKSGEADHIYGAWKVVKEATETEEGLQERACKVCGYKQTESVQKLTPSAPPEPSNPSVPSGGHEKPVESETPSVSLVPIAPESNEGKMIVVEAEAAAQKEIASYEEVHRIAQFEVECSAATPENPVTITFAIPTVAVNDKIIVMHKTASGWIQEKNVIITANGTVQVTVTSCSPFIFYKVTGYDGWAGVSASDKAKMMNAVKTGAASPKTGDAGVIGFMLIAAACGSCLVLGKKESV